MRGVFPIEPNSERSSMTAKQIFVAFPTSAELNRRTLAFIDAVRAQPDQSHQALLSAIPALFIDEVLAAFFQGPIDATGISIGL